MQAKIALSSTSIEGAKLNLASDTNGWNFAQARSDAENEWERYLSLIDITGSDEQKTVFYTAMYHLFTQPCDMADVDGHYRGIDDRIASLGEGRPYYSNLSLWDTYRAANPLYTILTPEIVDDLVNSMVAHHEGLGYLPIWPLWGQETYCMIANHAIPVIVEAYNKGFRGFDAERAYRAIRETSFREDPTNRKSPWFIYEKHGYYPMDLIRFESVSRTLETAYDDYCGAQMAQALGHMDDYEHFMKRTGYIRNLFDPSIGFFRGRKSDGTWETPFDPLNVCHNSNGKGSFTEGNAWKHLWHGATRPPGVHGVDGRKEEVHHQTGFALHHEVGRLRRWPGSCHYRHDRAVCTRERTRAPHTLFLALYGQTLARSGDHSGDCLDEVCQCPRRCLRKRRYGTDVRLVYFQLHGILSTESGQQRVRLRCTATAVRNGKPAVREEVLRHCSESLGSK